MALIVYSWSYTSVLNQFSVIKVAVLDLNSKYPIHVVHGEQMEEVTEETEGQWLIRIACVRNITQKL
jgi:hypothetical protein